MKKIVIIFCLLLIGIPSGVQAKTLEDYIVKANGTADVTINLYDYWLQEGIDTTDPQNKENMGINQNRLLLFHSNTNGGNNISNYGRWNTWNSGEPWQPVTGIVAPILNENGYPVLNIAKQDIENAKLLNKRNNESLEYLFNPDIEVPYRKVYKNVKGLFQRSATKGDFYSSYENFAEYDNETNSFLLYSEPAIYGARATGQFFPLNKGEEVFEIDEDKNQLIMKSISSNSEILNHYLGMTIETEFEQPKNGQATNEETKKKQDMVYTFTGDDDIWIYIDNVLVADLGGIHNAITTQINFATGKVVIKPSDSSAVTTETTKEYFLGDIYNGATNQYTDEYMKTNFIKETDENGKITKYTFKDDSVHNLKIFYLERGNTDSNLEASFWPSIKGKNPISEEENKNPTPPATPQEEKNPETNDLLIIAICGIAISIIGVVAIARFYKYKIKST